MPSQLFASTFMSIALLLCSGPSLAESKTEPGARAIPPSTTNTQNKNTKSKDSNASARIKLVDINRASKKELRSLQGISDTMADKIIAGRPYNSKAAIVTNGAVPEGIYVAIRKQIEVR